MYYWVVVATHLVERSLDTPEIRSSNPVIGKFYLLPSNSIKAAFSGKMKLQHF